MKTLQFLVFVVITAVSGVKHAIPVITLDRKGMQNNNETDSSENAEPLKYLQFITLVGKNEDTSDFWRETEILSLILNQKLDIDYVKCKQNATEKALVNIPSRRAVRPICKSGIDFQICPQCPHFNNTVECELFRDSCKERRVNRNEYDTYCNQVYGKWKTMFLPADYSKCRCCDECIMFRELDQSCMEDDYNFDVDEFLPVTSIDFRAGCNPYWGHPEQELRALRCDKILRRCVPVTVPQLPNETMSFRRSYRFQPPLLDDCPMSCRGYECPTGTVTESKCPQGAFIPNKELCNCCGNCSSYQQLGQKCAEFKKTVHDVNGSQEIEVEEEFLEPGCDDGLVCRQGVCQDIHMVQTIIQSRRKRQGDEDAPYEPCKQLLKYFKKKYGTMGHLHYDAPQCTPLWLFAPVQCRRFVCYCALENGSFIKGIKVPRVEVSNMNCDCAREKCRTKSNINNCDGYGGYLETEFVTPEETSTGSKQSTIT